MMSIHEQTLDGEGEGKEQAGDSGLDPDEVADAPDDVKLGDLEALRGVVKFPVRIKCATLSWNTLAQGIDEARELTLNPPGGSAVAGRPRQDHRLLRVE